MSRRDYTRGANRRAGGGGIESTYLPPGKIEWLGLNKARFNRVPQQFGSHKPKKPKRVARALGAAKGLMGAEKWLKRIRAEAFERHASDVPRGHRRIRRTDPITGEVHTLDLPIPPGKAFDRLLDALRHGEIDPYKVAPLLRDWELEFIRTGRYCPD